MRVVKRQGDRWERERESEDPAETVQAGKFAVSRDCGGNEWIQEPFFFC